MNEEFYNNQQNEYGSSNADQEKLNEVNMNEVNLNEFNNNEVNNNEVKMNEVNMADVNMNDVNMNADNTDTEYTYSNNNAADKAAEAKVYSENINMYNTYSNQAVQTGDKPKKKKRVIWFFKLTAAALAFGLVAGAAFQGYYILTNPAATKEETNDGNTLKAEEVAQTSSTGETAIPATSAQGVVTDVSDVVSKVMPSIVAINSTADVTNRDIFGREYTQQAQASGSGIIVGQNNSELFIVTNNHVIAGSETVEVVFNDNTKASATVKGADANSDLAILSVDMSELSDETAAAIKIASIGNSDEVKPGEMAIAIGNALGYGQSVTVGFISAVNRDVTIGNQTQTLLQTDAAINPGNSGGALLNASGQLIGINCEKSVDVSVEGMGYAIPISEAVPMINELINRQLVSAGDQGYLGIDASTAQDVTDVYSQRFNMPVGVYVNDVIKDSPAEAAGLKQGDIITGLDGNKIASINDLISALSYKKEGQKINLVIQVKDKGAYVEKTLEITLGKK